MTPSEIEKLAAAIHESERTGNLKRAAELAHRFVDLYASGADKFVINVKRAAHAARKETHVVVGDHTPEPRQC